MVRKQLESALELLAETHAGPPDEVVHEARKCLKKLRAVLRLVRPQIREKTYRAENITFRDAARPLTEVRDAKALIEALDKLVECSKEQIGARSFGDIRKALEANLDAVRRQVLDEQSAFSVVGDVVSRARERVKDWTAVPNRWLAIGKGLEDTYRRAAAAYKVAVADTSAETLHEWRKQAKYLRYQLEMLQPLSPQHLEELANKADEMGELLGDDHDLAVLRQMLNDDPDRFGEHEEREPLLALIDQRRSDLEQVAMRRGARFFKDGPRKFARRLKGYWKAWRNASAREQPAELRSAPA